MTKQEFRELAEGRLVFLDGATGSNLQKAGMPAGVCPEQWILENPESLIKLQKRITEILKEDQEEKTISVIEPFFDSDDSKLEL